MSTPEEESLGPIEVFRQCTEHVVVEDDAALYICVREAGHDGQHRAIVEWG